MVETTEAVDCHEVDLVAIGVIADPAVNLRGNAIANKLATAALNARPSPSIRSIVTPRSRPRIRAADSSASIAM